MNLISLLIELNLFDSTSSKTQFSLYYVNDYCYYKIILQKFTSLTITNYSETINLSLNYFTQISNFMDHFLSIDLIIKIKMMDNPKEKLLSLLNRDNDA